MSRIQTAKIFGWSLPPGCHKLPGEEEPDYPWEAQPRCPNCGAWLPQEPERVEPWEKWILGDNDGFYGFCGPTRPTEEGTEVLVAAGYTEIWTCKKCKQEVRISA